MNVGLSKAEARAGILSLVNNYIENKRIIDSYSETDTRIKLIDRMFEYLGWDVGGKEIPDEVQREEGIRDKLQKTKKADYVFRISSISRLVVEAKATGIGLEDRATIQQTVNYAANIVCSWAVLTNFRNVIIFFVNRKANIPFYKINLSTTEDFDVEFGKLWLLSKESIINNLLEKEAKNRGITSDKIPIDQQLLKDLQSWRELLSRDIRKRYGSEYETHTIDEMVQKIIDRLIFIRKTEDAMMEEPKLKQILARPSHDVYSEIKNLFGEYRQIYDSNLFGKDKKDLSECDKIQITSEVVQEVTNAMYSPKGSDIEYDFSIIDSDVLGRIYEQYLGYILRKSAKLAESQTHRKEQGIYYTPTRIVAYIVNNTVGGLLENKKIEHDKIKILDMACGSGSFLIKTFDFLHEYHLRTDKDYLQTTLDPSVETGTYAKKLKLLQSSIFGVDLDEQAVEIAQLNLLLKVAEKGQRLPLLQQNIKQGNSLIDISLDPKDHSFNWIEKFPFLESEKGFDVIIGNPPYVFGGNAGITPKQKLYFQSNYGTAKRKLNLFSLFIERSINLLKDGGIMAFIVPNTLLRVTSYEAIREFILKKTKILQIVNLEAGVFEGVTASTIIILLQKENDEKKIQSNKALILEGLDGISYEKAQKEFLTNNLHIFDLGSGSTGDSITTKINDGCTKLGPICKEMIFGVVITKNRDEVVSNKKLNAKYKKFLEGRDIERYGINFSGKFLLYDRTRLHRPRRPEIFEAEEKILVQRISGGKRPLKATLDNQQYYNKESINNIILQDRRFHINYILALLNSSLINWYYSMKFTNASELTVNVSKAYLSQLPIKSIPPAQQEPIILLVDKMLSLKIRLSEMKGKLIDDARKLLEEINEVDSKIDNLIYKLYGMTEEERRVIENSLK